MSTATTETVDESPPLSPILADFELVRQIGSGAWGSVYDAVARRDLPFARKGEHVGVKRYHPGLVLQDLKRSRILREFKTGLQLRHQNLVRFHALELDVDQPFLVMEFCDGENLAKWRKAHSEPTEEFLLQFATQMLEVLTFLHSSGRVHRDVKPSNINVDLDGRIRLLDYGLVLDSNQPGITADDSAKFLGTYLYAAPESIFDKTDTAKSDLYSFGATLYYLLHGTHAFGAAAEVADVINAKKTHALKMNKTFDGHVANAIYQLSRHLLEPNPDDRPASATECWEILARAIPTNISRRLAGGRSSTPRRLSGSRRMVSATNLLHFSPPADVSFTRSAAGRSTLAISYFQVQSNFSEPRVFPVTRFSEENCPRNQSLTAQACRNSPIRLPQLGPGCFPRLDSRKTHAGAEALIPTRHCRVPQKK
jgi:serine/threonine protein kinase